MILIFFYIIPLSVTIIGTFLYVEDTPLFLITLNEPEQSYKSLLRIAKINGI
jgi:hypothetical protein